MSSLTPSNDILLSKIDMAGIERLTAVPELAEVAQLLQGMIRSADAPSLFVFGHPPDSFTLDRYQITLRSGLYDLDPTDLRGKPLILGARSAESLGKEVGDSLQLDENTFRVVGIYETGAPFEDRGAVLRLEDAQIVLGRPRQASLLYVWLESAEAATRFRERIQREFPALAVSTAEDLADRTNLLENLRAVFWGVAMLTLTLAAVGITIGGILVLNALLSGLMAQMNDYVSGGEIAVRQRDTPSTKVTLLVCCGPRVGGALRC